MNNDEPLLLTVRETAIRARVSRQTVINWLDKGLIPGTKIGNKILIPRVALDQVLGLECAA
jgi:excisionase family DNA binding protein